jgi:hypothetical protein
VAWHPNFGPGSEHPACFRSKVAQLPLSSEVNGALPLSKREPANERITGLQPLRVLVSLVVLLPAIFIGVTSWRSLQRHFAEAEDRLSRTLSVVHEHTVKVFETQELVALQVDTLLDGLTDEEVQSRERALNTRLKTLIAALPQIQDVWVLTKTGTLSSPEPSSPRPEHWISPIASTSASSGMASFDPARLTSARSFGVEPRTSTFFNSRAGARKAVSQLRLRPSQA